MILDVSRSPKTESAIVRGIVAKKDRVLIGTDALRIEALARILGPGGARVIASATLRGSFKAKQRAAKAATAAQDAKAATDAKAANAANLSPRT